MQKLIPVVFVLAFGTIVLYNTVPAVRLTIEGIVAPESTRAKASCREHALSQSATPGFARIVEYGTANRLPDGFYVEDVVIGEMSDQGTEVEVEVTCYVQPDGQIIKSARRPHGKTAAATDNDSDPFPRSRP